MASTIFSLLLLTLITTSAQQHQIQDKYDRTTIAQSDWTSTYKTIYNVNSIMACAAQAARYGQCQLWFDPSESSCKIGSSNSLYGNGSSSSANIDVYFYSVLGGWSQWSTCSISCSGGTPNVGTCARSRNCSMLCPAANSSPCPGLAQEVQNASLCPVTPLLTQMAQTLPPTDPQWSSNNTYLIMQNDGNLVLYYKYNSRNMSMWASNTAGLDGIKAVFQSDGNLVVYDSSNSAQWSSGTSGNICSLLKVQNDGNVAIYNGANQLIWNTGTFYNGAELLVGQKWSSPKGCFYLTLTSVDLFLYKESNNQQLWRSNSVNQTFAAYKAVMQQDGNLVVYDASNNTRWSSQTQNRPYSYVKIQDDANVVIYDGGTPCFATGTSGSC